MKSKLVLWLTLFSFATLASAQPQPPSHGYTLEYFEQQAQQNYPKITQQKLLQQIESLDLLNLNHAYLPQVSFSGKGTYQSDVLTLPAGIPGIKPQTNDQFQVVGEVQQLLWDGGEVDAAKSIASVQAEIDRQKLGTDLHQLKQRVSQLYFGLLLISEQLIENQLLQIDLQSDYDQLKAMVHNGNASQSDLNLIRLELLDARQKQLELSAAQKTYKKSLSLLINQPLPDDAILEKPVSLNIPADNEPIRQPELLLLEAQKALYEKQNEASNSGNLPKTSLFLEGGYGKPGLNMINPDPATYAIGGVSLLWNFGGLYAVDNNEKLLSAHTQIVQSEIDAFLITTRLTITSLRSDIEKFRAMLENDDEIIALRTELKKTSDVKLKNGLLSTLDLIRDINALHLAKRDKAIHQIELLQAEYNLQLTVGDAQSSLTSEKRK